MGDQGWLALLGNVISNSKNFLLPLPAISKKWGLKMYVLKKHNNNMEE
jgi:hypothetical protein